MAIHLEDKWIWDSWYVHDSVRWHGYFLQADRSLGDPRLRHRNVSIGHAVSDDLVNWELLGTCFAPFGGPAFDDETTWTGSVVHGDDGRWHLFYTGTSKAEDAKVQRIGHAVSDDLHNWQRVGDGLCLDLEGPNAGLYEVTYTPGHWYERAMRDPWVMRDPDGEGWLMYFTARAPGIEEANEGGAIGFATSRDLVTWTLEPPVFVGAFGHHEVPQVLEIAGRWYCLFCCSAGNWSKAYAAAVSQEPVTGSHYLVGDGPRGPWRVAPGDFLDSGAPINRYAARILDADGLKILGFARGTTENFIGIVTDPDDVTVDADGLLHVVPRVREAE
ncbi:hypothetical protein ACFFP0_08945 [Rhizobium puerariae]|uniref:Glycosyl hydrolase family 32 N-terminal domain-containing protein n=1 Tax=Rhizobium puerariae TaxID=1585791 RepID=A0ABV6AEH2_9HYPH